MYSFLEFLGVLFVCILIALVIGWMYYITDSVNKLRNQVDSNAKISNNNYDEYEDRFDELEKKVKKLRRNK